MFWLLFRLVPLRLVALAVVAVAGAVGLEAVGVPVADMTTNLLGIGTTDVLSGWLA